MQQARITHYSRYRRGQRTTVHTPSPVSQSSPAQVAVTGVVLSSHETRPRVLRSTRGARHVSTHQNLSDEDTSAALDTYTSGGDTSASLDTYTSESYANSQDDDSTDSEESDDTVLPEDMIFEPMPWENYCTDDEIIDCRKSDRADQMHRATIFMQRSARKLRKLLIAFRPAFIEHMAATHRIRLTDTQLCRLRRENISIRVTRRLCQPRPRITFSSTNTALIEFSAAVIWNEKILPGSSRQAYCPWTHAFCVNCGLTARHEMFLWILSKICSSSYTQLCRTDHLCHIERKIRSDRASYRAVIFQ